MVDSLTKPPHGAPCNRCGVCCRTELCKIGEQIFKHLKGPCPAIIHDEQGLPACGVYADPIKYAPDKVLLYGLDKIKETISLLGAYGQGCTFYFKGIEPPSQSFYKKMTQLMRTDARYEQAIRIWQLRLRR